MGRWNSVESIQSSTWRELEAVYRVLLSLLDILQGQKVKWYTDNQNIVHILEYCSIILKSLPFSMAVFSFQKIISSTTLLFTITGASQPACYLVRFRMEHGTGGGICNREENYKINEYFRSNL
jgi:hypothetical protein